MINLVEEVIFCHTVHLFPSRDIHNYHNIFLSRSFSANNFFDADGIGGGWEANSSAENYEQCFWPNGFNKMEKCTSLLTAHGPAEHSARSGFIKASEYFFLSKGSLDKTRCKTRKAELCQSPY